MDEFVLHTDHTTIKLNVFCGHAHREAKVQKIYLSGSLRVSFSASAMFGYIVLSSTYVYVHSSVYLVSLNTGLCGCTMSLRHLSVVALYL